MDEGATMGRETQAGAVLVVDQDPCVQRAIVILLEDDARFRTILARSLDGALDALSTEPDVCAVIVDVSPPADDGVETLRRLRRAHPAVEVIVTTAFPWVAAEALRAGAAAVLSKPLDPDQLLATLGRIAAAMARGIDGLPGVSPTPARRGTTPRTV
jgi:DNA-binding NtrC family response regulator